MRLQKTVIVDKPLDAVFDYLSDFTTTTDWDPGTVTTVNQRGDGGVGTAYLNTSTFLGRQTQLTYIVREFVPGQRIRPQVGEQDAHRRRYHDLPRRSGRHRGDLHSRVHLQRAGPAPRPTAQVGVRAARQTSADRHA